MAHVAKSGKFSGLLTRDGFDCGEPLARINLETDGRNDPLGDFCAFCGAKTAPSLMSVLARTKALRTTAQRLAL